MRVFFLNEDGVIYKQNMELINFFSTFARLQVGYGTISVHFDAMAVAAW